MWAHADVMLVCLQPILSKYLMASALINVRNPGSELSLLTHLFILLTLSIIS